MITAIILGIIEGLTEFLPVSSTGHLILANQFIKFSNPQFSHTFDIFIQLGAILAIIIYFRQKLIPYLFHQNKTDNKQIIDLWLKTLIAFIPAAIIGLVLGDFIKEKLFNPLTVAITLLVGGIILVIIERKPPIAKIKSLSNITYQNSLLIGIFQCLALIPGTSRSAATIVTALLLGFSRPIATEFSFFLAIPTLAAASFYSLYKTGFSFSSSEILLLTIGFISTFIISYLVISRLIKFISHHSFQIFGYYRIVLAIIILAYFFL